MWALARWRLFSCLPNPSDSCVHLNENQCRLSSQKLCKPEKKKRQIISYISIMSSLIHVSSKLCGHDLSNLSLHGCLSVPLIISFALPWTFPMFAFRGREVGIGSIIPSECVSCSSVIPLFHYSVFNIIPSFWIWPGISLVFWINNAFQDCTELLAKTTWICKNNVQF